MKYIKQRKFSFLFLLLLLFSCSREDDSTIREPDQKLFTLLYPTHTNINFQNTLSEGPNTNILMYEYFYNGGGVAVGDFNQDGLEDLYFTANMAENKLYLNRGNLQFQDITQISGAAGRSGPWKTGVSVVDINADGLLDIYLCYSGSMPAEKRVNQLFVNNGTNENGIPTFTERAEEFGLDSPGFSNQAYFFDADRDNDLDMILLNHNPKNLPILNEAGTVQMMKQDSPEMGLRFFKNDQGKFHDETKKAGLNGSALSYGLGLGISDFNEDGWPDFYVSNDYAVPDFLYINNGDGTFRNELTDRIGHTSKFSMGNDIADVNNDGTIDIFTLDMLPEDNKRQKLLLVPDNWNQFDQNFRSGFYYQYMRNMLQLNNGKGSFSEAGQWAGISNTDWSWSALFADYDNDGWKDLFVSNGYTRDYTNMDFIKYMDDFVAEKGRLMREDVLEIIKHMPASDVVNYIFKNNQGQFENKTVSWGLDKVSNSNGSAYADLDNDGDLDLIVNNVNQAAFVYRNDIEGMNWLSFDLKGPSGNPAGLGAEILVKNGNKLQKIEQNPYRGYQSTVTLSPHLGLGTNIQADQVWITWPDGKQQRLENVKANQRITLDYKNASEKPASSVEEPVPYFTRSVSGIDFTHKNRTARDYDRQSLLINELSFDGPAMAKGDVNGDGLEDLFIGGGAGQLGQIYMQLPSGNFERKPLSVFDKAASSEDTDAGFADLNGDGFADLYVCSGGYNDFSRDDIRLQDRLYLGDGKGNFSEAPLPQMLTSSSVVAFHDINEDGATDLFIGGRCVPGNYPEKPRSYLLINDGKGNFTDKTLDLAPELGYLGMVTDGGWADLNADGKMELIVVGEWLPVTVFEWYNSKFAIRTDTYFDEDTRGWWNSLTLADINNDGREDLLLGNMGENTQFQASEQTPLEMYASDFDRNGSIDPIFCYYVQGKSYPFLTRDELVGQIPSLKSQFNTYASYAAVGLDKIIPAGELKKADYFKAVNMQTTFMVSQENGKYSKIPLPAEVQFSPVHEIVVDGSGADQQVMLFGNCSRTKLRFGKFDANFGQVLQKNGNSWELLSLSESGLEVKGDIRSAVWINNKLVLGRNGNTVLTFKK